MSLTWHKRNMPVLRGFVRFQIHEPCEPTSSHSFGYSVRVPFIHLQLALYCNVKSNTQLMHMRLVWLKVKLSTQKTINVWYPVSVSWTQWQLLLVHFQSVWSGPGFKEGQLFIAITKHTEIQCLSIPLACIFYHLYYIHYTFLLLLWDIYTYIYIRIVVSRVF